MKIWSELSLSASLEVPQLSQIPTSSFSIFLNHADFLPETEPKAWLLDNIDIRAPRSVLCAEFERLGIQMRFQNIRKKSRTTSKRLKSISPDPDSPESMLLEYVQGLEGDSRRAFYKSLTDVLPKDLSSSIAKCFDDFPATASRPLPHSIDQPSQPSTTNTMRTVPAMPPNATRPLTQTGLSNRFPKQIVDKLQGWLDRNIGKTSPTNDEKLELMELTGLKRSTFSTHISGFKMMANRLLQPK